MKDKNDKMTAPKFRFFLRLFEPLKISRGNIRSFVFLNVCQDLRKSSNALEYSIHKEDLILYTPFS